LTDLFLALLVVKLRFCSPSPWSVRRLDSTPTVSPVALPLCGGVGPGYNGRKRVLFLVHCYELGGAEAFALRAIELAGLAGFETHVFSSVPSIGSDFIRFSVAAHVIVRAAAFQNPGDVCTYVRRHGIDILHIHHNDLAYRALPALRRECPLLRVVDSTHVVEYYNGGYPRLSARYSDFLDAHHVISALLAKYICDEYLHEFRTKLSPAKFFTGYLSEVGPFLPVRESFGLLVDGRQVIRLLFFGRIEHQKQPYLFVSLLVKLNRFVRRQGLPIGFQGVVIGSGSLEGEMRLACRSLIRSGQLKFCGRIDDKDTAFGFGDILVLTSRNEGIALTCFEALRRGVPIVSADVGAQRELLPREMLFNLWGRNRAEVFIRRIIQFSSDAAFRGAVVRAAQDRLRGLSEARVDMAFLIRLYSGSEP
jgi:glycosyltransferase involved in cell wall biosynthesis